MFLTEMFKYKESKILWAGSNFIIQENITCEYFQDGINEKQESRSSMVPKLLEGNIPMIVCHATIDESYTPKKTPLKQGPMTPKTGKENLHHNLAATPKSNLVYTPTRLTRSALKLNDGFATPRAPLSAAKTNMQRTASTNNLAFKTTPSNMFRSKMAGTAKPIG